jgi:hypothetical protein
LWGSITGQIINDWISNKKKNWELLKKNLEITVRHIISTSDTSESLEFFRNMFRS